MFLASISIEKTMYEYLEVRGSNQPKVAGERARSNSSFDGELILRSLSGTEGTSDYETPRKRFVRQV